MKRLSTFMIGLALGVVSVGSCLADIASVSGTGTAASIVQPSNVNTLMDGYYFPTAVISDNITSLSSQIAFTYAAPADYGSGDRLIIEVINGTGSKLTNVDFTLSGGSGPQYYFAPYGSNPPYQGVPSAGIYNSIANTYTTTADVSGDVNPAHTAVNIPFTLPAGQEQDFYFAVNYTGTPGDFTLTQDATAATPEPGLYGALALGLAGLIAAVRRRKIA